MCQLDQAKKYNERAKSKDPEAWRKKSRDRQRSERKRAYDVLDVLKSVPCADCGLRFHPICMDFDHRDPTKKKMTIARAVGQKVDIVKILEEVKKCDVVCSNCHRLRAHKLRW